MPTYNLLQLLGTGGFADVHRAARSDTGMEVAVKILREPWDRLRRDRFREESVRQQRAAGPRIVRIVDENHDCEEPFVVLELMTNGSLADRLDREYGTRVQRWKACCALEATTEIAEALADAHARNLIHHDVKPANLLYNNAHRLVLSDFGCAATRLPTGIVSRRGVCGTEAYGAPEQQVGLSSVKVDVYAIGVILYELLVGAPLPQGWWTKRIPWPFEGLGGVHVEIVTLIRMLANPTPTARPTAAQAAQLLSRARQRFMVHAAVQP